MLAVVAATACQQMHSNAPQGPAGARLSLQQFTDQANIRPLTSNSSIEQREAAPGMVDSEAPVH